MGLPAKKKADPLNVHTFDIGMYVYVVCGHHTKEELASLAIITEV